MDVDISSNSFTPLTKTNGKMLKDFINKNISIIVNFQDVASGGYLVKCKSTDGMDLRIDMTNKLTTHLPDWIEVIGKPTSQDTIQCSEIILFQSKPENEPFDSNAYNMAVQFLRNGPEFYRQR